MASEQAIRAVNSMMNLGIEFTHPSPELHRRALIWAERLGHSKSYDAQYLAVAEYIQAELWTADRRLVNAARHQELNWVHWIGENSSPDRSIISGRRAGSLNKGFQ